MRVLQKSLKLKPVEYYTMHLNIVNSILPKKLKGKEIEVLARFMSSDPKLIEQDMFNSIVRKQVMEQLNLSAGGLGNYLKSMLKKGFLEKNEITKKITVKEYLIPEEKFQGYQFKILKDEETDK